MHTVMPALRYCGACGARLAPLIERRGSTCNDHKDLHVLPIIIFHCRRTFAIQAELFLSRPEFESRRSLIAERTPKSAQVSSRSRFMG
jgi:hypothetical protein